MSLSLPLDAFIAHMSGADFFGLVVSVISGVPLLRADSRREVLYDLRGLAHDRPVRGDPHRAGVAAGPIHGRGVHRRAHVPDPIFGSPERFLYKVMRVDARRGPGLEVLREKPLDLLARGLAVPLLHPAHSERCSISPALNPLGYHSAPWNVTFNTVSSFVTNTNWQYYSGETTMSYFSQMIGLTVQNCLSAGVGIVVAVALMRGIIGRGGKSIGNFWQDLVRTDPVRARADLVRRRAGARLPGRRSRTSRLPERTRDHRARPIDRDGTGRLAGGDQGARDERRRLLQRQLCASVREPHGVHATSSRCCSC